MSLNSRTLKYSLVVLISICVLSILFVVANLRVTKVETDTVRDSWITTPSPTRYVRTEVVHPTSYEHSDILHTKLPQENASEEYKNLMASRTSSRSSKLVKLHWTSLYGKHDNDSYNFFSAYYDSRANPKQHRPAVIVMGYVHKEVRDIHFYCVLKYSNGSRSCSKEAAFRQFPTTCGNRILPEFQFFCKVGSDEEPPVSVQLSTSNTCEPQFFSGEIPVRNRKYTSMTQVAPKKIGVCVGGPLVQKLESPTVIKNVVEFVEMSTALGVELIVLYVNETQVDIKVLEFIWKHYPDTVRTVGWKAFDKWYPMHYHGQLLIISDCLYRVMYEVEYLAVIDLDEMIIPIKHNNLAEMVTAFGDKPMVASFKFQNAFFVKPSKGEPHVPPKFNCPANVTLAKYFTRTDRYRCYPGYSYRTKIMSRPRYIYEHSIHSVCQTVHGHKNNYDVPPHFGVLSHYRGTIPSDCIVKPKSPDYITKRFLERVTQRICARFAS